MSDSSPSDHYFKNRAFVLILYKYVGNAKILIRSPINTMHNSVPMLLACADPEVRQSNTEENLLYFMQKKYNRF